MPFEVEEAVCVCYGLDRSLFDLNPLTAKTKSQQHLLQEVLFSEDCALVARVQSATDAGPLLRCLQALWSDNQPQY